MNRTVVERFAIAVSIVSATFYCHQRTAHATATAAASFETDCIENSCSTNEIDEYHEAYENESLIEYDPANIEENLEIASNRSTSEAKARHCSAVVMLRTFYLSFGGNVELDDLKYHELLCQKL